MSAPNIGDLLRAWGHITPEQLRRAVELQKEHPTERLGQLLVRLRAVSPQVVTDTLDKQQAMRAGSVPTMRDTIALAQYATSVLEGRLEKA